MFSPRQDKLQGKKKRFKSQGFSFLFYQISAMALILFEKLHEKQIAPKLSWTPPKIKWTPNTDHFLWVLAIKTKYYQNMQQQRMLLGQLTRAAPWLMSAVFQVWVSKLERIWREEVIFIVFSHYPTLGAELDKRFYCSTYKSSGTPVSTSLIKSQKRKFAKRSKCSYHSYLYSLKLTGNQISPSVYLQ